MPNATVAQTIRATFFRNASCTASRTGRERPEWYASAVKPRFLRSAAHSSVSFLLRQYTIPDSFLCRQQISASWIAGFFFLMTRYCRFSRSKLPTNSLGFTRPSCRQMSLRTSGAAVAVSAITGADGKHFRSRARSRYSGRKSWPHSEMQCASSIATSRTGKACRNSRNPGFRHFSGEINRSRSLPSRIAVSIRLRPGASSMLFHAAAMMPRSLSASTWSFMSARRGEITMVRPPKYTAGSW